MSSIPSRSCSSKSSFKCVATKLLLHQRAVRAARVTSASTRCALISSSKDLVGGDAGALPLKACMALFWAATLFSSSTKDRSVSAAEAALA